MTHWIGFVVRDEGGSHYLIGQDCGAKHYGGERFRVATRRFDDIEYIRFIEQRLASITRLANSVDEEIESLLSSDAITSIERKRGEIQAASPMAAGRLVTHAASGLSLSAHERARGVRGSGFILTHLGQIEGPALIYNDIRSRCSELKTSVGRAVSVSNADPAEKIKAVDSVEKAARAMLKAAADLGQAHRFFLIRNYRRLARWSAPMVRFFSISHEGRTLLINDAHVGLRRINPLDQPELPSLRACNQLLDSSV